MDQNIRNKIIDVLYLAEDATDLDILEEIVKLRNQPAPSTWYPPVIPWQQPYQLPQTWC